CDSYTLPGLTAGNNYFTGAGGTGTPLNPGDLITTSQTIFIYAASGTTPSCTDESSFDITIDTTPTLVVLNTQCSLDLSTYEVSLQTTIGILTSSPGTVVGNDRISDIPAGTDITITLTNNGCSDTLVITAPDCYCPTLDIPENQTNGANCEGQPTATVTATMPTSGGDTINWYNTSAGGTPIATGNSFTPIEIIPGTYTYYAENFDSITACASNRIEVMLTITTIPTITLVANSTSCEFYTLPNLAADQDYFTGTNGTGITLTAGQTITTTQTIYILATAPENTNCQAESSFDITILQEPILDLPTELALCADANGNQQELFLGTDLGPGFRYDWTPNNDTNGDGIEEAIFRITTEGTYTLEVYEIANGSECGGFTTYSTNVSNVAQPVSLTAEVTAEGYELDSGNRIRLLAGDDPLLYNQFEYSITGPNGPYQSDNIFTDLDGGLYTGYVRAISGCRSLIASEPFLIINYPTFFTPNGDGINETWRPLGLENLNITSEVDIYVYDRHGKLLTRLDPLGPGWDGTYNGQLMTSTDYWFKAFFRNELDNTPVFFNGHFSLKR
ncbi:MAG: gliding motility-associated-like protein, partial [Maribacter sp.]